MPRSGPLVAKVGRVTSPDPLEIRLRRRALTEGFSDADLERLVRSGDWSRLRRGAYLAAELPQDLATRHRLLVHATLRGLLRTAVVSHQSAAVLLGIPLWNVPLDKVHITRRPGATSRDRKRLRVHVARLRDDEIVRIGGLLVTSPVRTALDLARSLPFEPAVVALDASLRSGRIDHDQLRQRLFDLAGTPGSRAAARAVAFADGRSESVGESRSRVTLHALGIEPPTLQLDIRDSSGVHLGRGDFAWERERVIGESDGRVKYGRLLRPGQEPGDAVFEEKQREDAIRAENWGFVRWTWGDLTDPIRLGRRVQQALERGASSRR